MTMHAAGSVDELRKLTGQPWANISQAAASAIACRGRIREIVVEKGLIPADASLVVFGSLARNERTAGSDCDWTLLVDGQANGEHHSHAAAIEAALRSADIVEPGPTGLFGSLAFSHELVHQIGGEEDTNRITTRRVLLLLESNAITTAARDLVRDRVVKQIVKRYLEQEPDLVDPQGNRRYPRFLINDVVRYWRTMAVDYARKIRERQGKGWAIRNIKLRLSRKLTFVSGMLTCFECVLQPMASATVVPAGDEAAQRFLTMQEHILHNAESTPLEILARAVLTYSPNNDHRKALATSLFQPYDGFLGILNDEPKRSQLSSLSVDAAEQDPVFLAARQCGKDFQSGLLELFFNTRGDLTRATQEYGVF